MKENKKHPNDFMGLAEAFFTYLKAFLIANHVSKKINITQVKSMAQGIHIMPLGWTDVVPGILEQARVAI